VEVEEEAEEEEREVVEAADVRLRAEGGV